MDTQYFIEKGLLESLRNKREIKKSLQTRSKIVFDKNYLGLRRKDIIAETNLAATTVDRWLLRWDGYSGLRKSWYTDYKNLDLTLQEYKKLLYSVFSDGPRTGTPAKFTEQTSNYPAYIFMKLKI